MHLKYVRRSAKAFGHDTHSAWGCKDFSQTSYAGCEWCVYRYYHYQSDTELETQIERRLHRGWLVAKNPRNLVLVISVKCFWNTQRVHCECKLPTFVRLWYCSRLYWSVVANSRTFTPGESSSVDPPLISWSRMRGIRRLVSRKHLPPLSNFLLKLFVSRRDPCPFLYSLNHARMSMPRAQGASFLVLGSCSLLSFFAFTLCSYQFTVSHLQRVTSLHHTLPLSWCHCNSPFVLTPFSSAFYRNTLTQLTPIKCPRIVVKSNRTRPDSRKSVSSLS